MNNSENNFNIGIRHMTNVVVGHHAKFIGETWNKSPMLVFKINDQKFVTFDWTGKHIVDRKELCETLFYDFEFECVQHILDILGELPF